MGETQIYSQRLHGITEKRRILSEVDKIQRELEQQRVKLHQLKRKSLRDRWLMDGLVPTAGAETDNPLSETEGHIKELELQLESLQAELVYLENPELRALKGAKDQGATLQKELANGEKKLQKVDQNENLKEHAITEEADQLGDSHGEKDAITRKDTEEMERHPIPGCEEKNESEKHEIEHNVDVEMSNSHEPDDKQTPSQNADGSVHKDADDGHEAQEENEIQNSEHSHDFQDQKGDQKGEHQNQDGNPPEVTLDEEPVHKVESSLENTLEQEDQNLKSSTSELESVIQKDSLPILKKEDFTNDLMVQNQNNSESLLDEITKLVNFGEQNEANQQNQDLIKPSKSKEQLNTESILANSNEENGQNLEENQDSVLVSHAHGSTQDEKLALSLETEGAHPALLNIQEENKVTVAVIEASDDLNQGSILLNEDKTPNLAPLPLEITQTSVLPPSDQEVHTTLPCTDQVPSQLLPSEGQNQVQISQVLVVPAPRHEQRSSNSPQGPSVSPQTKETNSAPESQPLLHKPQETDTHQGANTAETRDKSAHKTKEKTCQCCVVM